MDCCPLLAYNHAAGDHRRRERAFRLGTAISFGFALVCLVCYEIFADRLNSRLYPDPATVAYGAVFLRCMVTAMPLMALCYPLIIQFQAMGRARESLICSILRKGVLDIPCSSCWTGSFPSMAAWWVQPIVDAVSLAVLHLVLPAGPAGSAARRGGGRMTRSEHDFSKGSISRNILTLAAPMTAAQLINVLYSVVDRIYLGRLPGHLALTGLGLVMPIISIVMGFANLCGTGGAPLCSIQRGRGDTEEAERVMGQRLHAAADLRRRRDGGVSGPPAAHALPLRRQRRHLPLCRGLYDHLYAGDGVRDDRPGDESLHQPPRASAAPA